MKNTFLAITMVVVALCGALAQTKSAPKAAPKVAPKAATPAKTAAKATGPNLMSPASLNAKAPPVYLVKLNTSKGPIVIRVTKSWAPVGADRFYNLVRAGFYNNDIIFRSTRQFAQFGIPARPEISRVWMNKTMFDDKVVQSNKRGTLTFASTGEPNSRGTQVFINKVDNGYLDAMGFPAIGEVIEGLDILDSLYTGYGETVTPLQGQIYNQGNAFLEKSYPRLDRITTAVIEPLPDDSKK